MTRYWHLCVSLLTLCIGMACMPAHAQVTLQSRSSNIPGGNIQCTGQEIVVPVPFTGLQALPTAVNSFIVGAEILVQNNPVGGVQHAFVTLDPGSMANNLGGQGNGFLVGLAAGEVHQKTLFPFNSNFVGEVAGFKVNTATPIINVSFACGQGFFQGQIFFYFIQF